MIPHRIVLASAAGLVSALLLGACDSSSDGASGGGASAVNAAGAAPATTAAPDPAASVPATAPAGGDSANGGSADGGSGTTTALAAETVKGVGDVVTDDRGRTLYRYDRDRPDPSRWTCAGACVKTWVPVIVGRTVRTEGVEKSLLGTVHRDGRTQVTLAGWPLYRYVGDTGAGQLNGEGRDNQWYAVAPTGRKAAPTR